MPWSRASCAERYLSAAALAPIVLRQSTSPARNTRTVRSDIRIANHFRFAAGMGHCALERGPHLIGILAQCAALVGIGRGFPSLLAFSELGFVDFEVERA